MPKTPTKMKCPAHPGAVVRELCLGANDLSVVEAAKVLGVSRSALNRLLSTDAALSWNMAIRISKAFGSNPDYWMRMQFAYDSSKASERARTIKVSAYRPMAQAVHD